MSRVMRKPTFSMYENEDADQLRGNVQLSDQRLCFCYKNCRSLNLGLKNPIIRSA